jgi:predicted RNA methylase
MPESFKERELAGWQSEADAYDSLLATITNQAIDPILRSLGDVENRRLIDVACGTGHLSGAASKLGAVCNGIDFAGNVVASARRNCPNAS